MQIYFSEKTHLFNMLSEESRRKLVNQLLGSRKDLNKSFSFIYVRKPFTKAYSYVHVMFLRMFSVCLRGWPVAINVQRCAFAFTRLRLLRVARNLITENSRVPEPLKLPRNNILIFPIKFSLLNIVSKICKHLFLFCNQNWRKNGCYKWSATPTTFYPSTSALRSTVFILSLHM